MTVDAALSSLLEAAAEAGARRALELVADAPPRRRLVPAKSEDGLLAYRTRLEAIKSGRLRAYRVRGRTFVDLDEEAAFVGSAENIVRPGEPQEAEPDEVDELIEAQARRRRGGRRKAGGGRGQ